MSSVEVTAEQIQEGIFCQGTGENTISICCNWCALNFFSGDDVDHPQTNWLIDMIIHFNDKHQDELKRGAT